MADSTPKSYHTDPTLYLYTSLTAGSSHIITATSRLSTILKANKIPFQALDVATDEKARMLWGRRAGKRKLPGLVRAGMVIGDLEEVEEWNECGELKENVGSEGGAGGAATTTSAAGTPSKSYALPSTPSKPATESTTTTTPSKASTPTTDVPTRPAQATSTDSPLTTAMRQAGFEAAKRAGDAKTKARTDALDAAKERGGSLEKLDNAGPTGLPPPSGTTEAKDAVEGENGGAEVEGEADEVPNTKDVVDDGGLGAATGSGKGVEETGSKSKAADEESEVLEGKGQAQPSSVGEVPTAGEAEAAANEAIRQDKSHIVLAGHGQTPEGPTPPNEKEEDVEAVEKAGDAGEDGGSALKHSTSATDEAEALPGKKTQEQAAASGESVGDSVAD